MKSSLEGTAYLLGALNIDFVNLLYIRSYRIWNFSAVVEIVENKTTINDAVWYKKETGFQVHYIRAYEVSKEATSV